MQGLPGFSSIEATQKAEAGNCQAGSTTRVGRFAMQEQVHPVVSLQLCS